MFHVEEGVSLDLPGQIDDFWWGFSSRLVPWSRNRDGVNLDIDGAWRVPVVEAPARNAPLALLPEVKFPDPKIAPHTLYKVRPGHLPTPLAPQFLGFSPLF